MGIEVNQVTNANVYIDGTSLLGQVEECTLPVLKNKGQDHKALGMVGMLKLPSGFDALTAKFKFNSFYIDTYRKAANQFKAVSVQVRSSLETHDAEGLQAEAPCVVHLRGFFDELPLGGFKQHDNVELELSMNVTYFKLVIDGTEVVEFDVNANVYKVDGEDLLANYRANIGQ